MHEDIVAAVKDLLTHENGHGYDHVIRVRNTAAKFAEKEGADKNIVDLAALLHDVDDYKLFGEENAKNLTNANRILDESNIDDETKQKVLDIVGSMGYNKSLEGIRPTTLEGMIVSDADMCDAIGSQGILRTYAYNASRGVSFFDKNTAPHTKELSAEEYRAGTAHSAQHFLDKMLKISSMLMTNAGREDGKLRQKIMVDFLKELFREEDATDWDAHLDEYLKTLN